ncbi:class I SAM-dependent methyltransferase [Streptomyces sp. NPDC056716]|uniref:class I SAM-dependent methyltransferase n=1 Tax=unclassified Streptomyces TaxID=2593676 RepID=UPI0036D0D3CA
MTDQVTPTAVGAVYDEITTPLTPILGGSVHVGYWDGPLDTATVEQAADRLTGLVAGRLSAGRGGSVLDIGCGSGKPAAQIAASLGVHVTGITVSRNQWEIARSHPQPVAGGGTEFHLADAMRLPFDDGTFDAAYAIESLLHMSDPTAALAGAARVLRPGSCLVIADLYLDDPVDDHTADIIRTASELFQISHIATADQWRQQIHRAGLDLVDFTDVRAHVHRSYGLIAEFIRTAGQPPGVQASEQLVALAEATEAFGALPRLGYALMTAILH